MKTKAQTKQLKKARNFKKVNKGTKQISKAEIIMQWSATAVFMTAISVIIFNIF